MMKAILIAAATILQAYLLGSVDTGILVSKFVYHDDVRNHGSGAAGMTNMLRTFGKKAAAMTATGDVLKGVLAVCIGRWLFHMLPTDAGMSPYLGVYLAAIFAVLGHLYPLYFGFKGGTECRVHAAHRQPDRHHHPHGGPHPGAGKRKAGKPCRPRGNDGHFPIHRPCGQSTAGASGRRCLYAGYPGSGGV